MSFTKRPLYLQECSCGKLETCKICRSKYNRKKTLERTPEERRATSTFINEMKNLGIYTTGRERWKRN